MIEHMHCISPILILLCIMVSPASAEMDYTPKVLGNANMDGTIDQKDIDFLNAIIAGTESPTALADANDDGKIDDKDIDQVENILQDTESEISVIDALNRTVKIKFPVERVIVAFTPLAEEIVAIGADSKVVGVSSDIVKLPELFPELSKCQNVGRTKELDMEKIISLKPDLLVIYEGGDKGIINKLETAGIPVLFSEGHGELLHSISAIRRLGYVLGVADNAEEYTNWYGGFLDDISRKTEDLSNEEKPSVFYYWAPTDLLPMGTSGQGCPVISMINIAGGRDIAADRPGVGLPGVYVQIDPEWVIEQNPSVILWEALIPNNNAGYQVNNSTAVDMRLKDFANVTGFSNIDAVKNRNVYTMSFYILTANPWIGTVYLSKLLHPEIFKDLDPRAVHQEYLKRFLHLDYDINKRGLFLYPIPEDW
jgi:iron complex transport system substrate-binding protein